MARTRPLLPPSDIEKAFTLLNKRVLIQVTNTNHYAGGIISGIEWQEESPSTHPLLLRLSTALMLNYRLILHLHWCPTQQSWLAVSNNYATAVTIEVSTY